MSSADVSVFIKGEAAEMRASGEFFTYSIRIDPNKFVLDRSGLIADFRKIEQDAMMQPKKLSDNIFNSGTAIERGNVTFRNECDIAWTNEATRIIHSWLSDKNNSDKYGFIFTVEKRIR